MTHVVIWLISALPGLSNTMAAIFDEIKRQFDSEYDEKLFIQIDISNNLDEAKDYLKNRENRLFDSATRDGSAVCWVVCDAEIGEDFLKEFRLFYSLPVILLDSSGQREVTDKLRSYPNCYIIAMDRRLRANFTALFEEKILGRKTNLEPRAYLNLIVGEDRVDYSFEVDPKTERATILHAKGAGVITDEEKSGMEKSLRSLGKIVEKHDYPSIEKKVQEVGERIWSVIYNRPIFQRDLEFVRGRLGPDLSGLNIIVTLEDESFRIPVEFLYDKAGPKFLMFQAPIVRRLARSTLSVQPLFHDESHPQAKRVLLINAANADCLKWDGDEMSYDALEFAEQEVKAIRSSYRSSIVGQSTKSQEFKLIETQKMSRVQVVKQLSEGAFENKFDIVHFIGHATFRPRKEELVFLLSTESGFEVLPSDKFARILREIKARFVFLSCCHGANKEVVFDLARKGIPAILGFQWSVRDDDASDFAATFYANLFDRAAKKRGLPFVFYETRRHFWDQRDQTDVWAAPLLVMQYYG